MNFLRCSAPYYYISTVSCLVHAQNIIDFPDSILSSFNLPPQADVLEYYDQTVNSPNGSFNIPAVLRVCVGDSFFLCLLWIFIDQLILVEVVFFSFQVPHLLQVMKRKRVMNSLSRKNILYRDDYMCQ